MLGYGGSPEFKGIANTMKSTNAFTAPDEKLLQFLFPNIE
jgi:hypothetical protein